MQSRRNFIGKFSAGVAGALAAPGSVLSANSRIRLGLIGAGDRGVQIAREALASPNVEIVALADIYTRRLDAAQPLAPAAKTYLDYRYLLEDDSIDAVLIATPQHLHCQHFVDSLDAGKHVYQEKTMAFTVDHAKRMRAAYRKANRVVQIGHQACSSGQIDDASSFLASGAVGKVTAIHSHMHRNTPHGKPQWTRPVQPDMNSENILWSGFLGDAPRIDFDPQRYINWRFFWDYSGGNVHENLCHQLAFWYKVMDLGIPRTVSMSGGVYLWKDGREVPDTMSVAMEHSEELLFTWDSGFGNSQPGTSEEVLGTDGAITRGQQIRYTPQKVNRPEGVESVGHARTTPHAHMINFFDCIRSGAQPNCPFEIGYRVSIACRMAVESYRQGRPMRWDSAAEEIV